MEQIYDLIIVGSGPAGLSAAVNAALNGLNFIVLEGSQTSGGQLKNNIEIRNLPGFKSYRGPLLAENMKSHAVLSGAEIINEKAVYMDLKSPVKTIGTSGSEYNSRAVILAMGTHYDESGIRGEDQFLGAGVSYNAGCDAPFFDGKNAAVIGNGEAALRDVLTLSRTARNVYLIYKEAELNASVKLKETVLDIPNIRHMPKTVVAEVIGDNQIEAAWITDISTGESRTIALDGLFISTGIIPNSDIVSHQINLTYEGYIKADEDCRTSLRFVYAAGDIRQKPLRRIVTAVSDGASAVASFMEDSDDI